MTAPAPPPRRGGRTTTSWQLAEGDELAPGRRALRLLSGGRRYMAPEQCAPARLGELGPPTDVWASAPRCMPSVGSVRGNDGTRGGDDTGDRDSTRGNDGTRGGDDTGDGDATRGIDGAGGGDNTFAAPADPGYYGGGDSGGGYSTG